MPITIRNTKDLVSPGKLKLKVLLYAPSGFGKTSWAASAPNPGFCSAETGHGGGILSASGKGIDFFEPKSYSDVELFANGDVFKDKDTLVLDGMSYLTQTLVRDEALTIPRKGGESPKRAKGILELDDFGVLAELERRVLARMLSQDSHTIVTCLQDYYEPPQDGKPEKLGGPSLPGQMRLGSSAMFDIVLRMGTRSALRNPKDASSRYVQRYLQTEADGRYAAKCRLQNGAKQLFPSEVIYDKDTGQGDFNWFLAKATEAYGAKV